MAVAEAAAKLEELKEATRAQEAVLATANEEISSAKQLEEELWL